MSGGRSNRNPRHIVVAVGETDTKSVGVDNHYESCARARCCTMTAVGCSVAGLRRSTNGYCSRYDCDSRLYLGLHAGSHHFVNRRGREHVKDGVPQEGVLNDVGSVA
jgi:hypothetical protein